MLERVKQIHLTLLGPLVSFWNLVVCKLNVFRFYSFVSVFYILLIKFHNLLFKPFFFLFLICNSFFSCEPLTSPHQPLGS